MANHFVCEHFYQFEMEERDPFITKRNFRCVKCGRHEIRMVATIHPAGVQPPVHEFKTLSMTEVEIRSYACTPEIVVRHLPTGIVVKCKETNNPTLNKNAALGYLAEQVQAHLKEKAMPTVEKAYDKIILSAQDVQEALKEFIRKTTKREVRGDIKVNTNGNGFQTTAYAVLEDQPREAYDTPKAL